MKGADGFIMTRYETMIYGVYGSMFGAALALGE